MIEISSYMQDAIQNLIRVQRTNHKSIPETNRRVLSIISRIYEVGISYYGLTCKEGKKIKWRDGTRTIFCIFKYSWFAGKKQDQLIIPTKFLSTTV